MLEIAKNLLEKLNQERFCDCVECFNLSTTRYAIMDMDGVLYRGNAALAGLREFFDFLEQNQIKYLLVTNNSTMSSADYNLKLAKMGVDVPASLIVTSGEATAQWCVKLLPKERVFLW